jgi:hypothetical protein
MKPHITSAGILHIFKLLDAAIGIVIILTIYGVVIGKKY